MSKQHTKDQIITFDQSAELIGESEIVDRLDLGHSLLMRLKHPSHGNIAVLNSSVGQCAVMFL